MALEQPIAIVTPSFARDFEFACELNESVLRYVPAPIVHYLIVDGKDLPLFRSLEGTRTVVVAIEDVLPRGYFKLPYLKSWWLSTAAGVPAKGWLIQQLAKLAFARVARETVLVNVDSEVRFVRPIDPAVFAKDGKTRLYRLPGGVTAGMPHVKWHKNVCRLLRVAPDALPLDDYVGNVISWDRELVLETCGRIEAVTGNPWHAAFARGRLVSEYMAYGTYVDKVLGGSAARVWIDERSWCHTYWGPGPLPQAKVAPFVAAMRRDDVAFSVAGYTGTQREIVRAATELVLRQVAS
jgi:hypothetical protein